MSNSIIINCPWSYGDGIYETVDQTKEIFNLIAKAFLTKYKYMRLMAIGDTANAKKYDLSDIRVFNSFVTHALNNVLNPDANDYILDTLRTLRDHNINKKCVKTSYETFYNMLDPNTKLANLRNMLCENLEILDFRYLFNKCNKVAFTKESPEIKELQLIYDAISDMANLENKFV